MQEQHETNKSQPARIAWLGTTILGLCLAMSAHAVPYTLDATRLANSDPGLGLTPASRVEGKVYSNNLDQNGIGVLDSGQNIGWDGLGGVTPPGPGPVMNDYIAGDASDSQLQVDALANRQDQGVGRTAYGNVELNQRSLVFSVEGDGNIYFELINGASGLWATANVEINADTPPADVDGLELWGSETNDLANKFSLAGDPAGQAVVNWDAINGFGTTYLSKFDIAAAIGIPDLGELVDVDALMVWDDGRADAAGNPVEADGSFNAGTLNGVGWTDTVLFSLRPILLNGVTLFDGGEIWVWHATDQNAQFLNHGGHLWDTQFDVMGTFGVASENINALESVGIPLPPVIWLLALGLGAMLGLRRPAA